MLFDPDWNPATDKQVGVTLATHSQQELGFKFFLTSYSVCDDDVFMHIWTQSLTKCCSVLLKSRQRHVCGEMGRRKGCMCIGFLQLEQLKKRYVDHTWYIDIMTS